MTASVSVVARHRALRTVNATIAVTLTGNYATPGEVLTATSMGLYIIHGASSAGGMGGGTTGYVPNVELTGTAYVNSGGGNSGWTSVTLRFLATGASSGAALAELADGAYGTALTAKPIILSVWGRTN